MNITRADQALETLTNQEWFEFAGRPEIEATAEGGYTVWCGSEAYRISPDGEIFRIYVRGGEVVLL